MAQRYKRYGDAKMAAIAQSVEKDTLMRLWKHPKGGYTVAPMNSTSREDMPSGLAWYATACGGYMTISTLTERAPRSYSCDHHSCQVPLLPEHVDELNRIADRIGVDARTEAIYASFGKVAPRSLIHRPWENPNPLPSATNPYAGNCFPRIWGGEERWRIRREEQENSSV